MLTAMKHYQYHVIFLLNSAIVPIAFGFRSFMLSLVIVRRWCPMLLIPPKKNPLQWSVEIAVARLQGLLFRFIFQGKTYLLLDEPPKKNKLFNHPASYTSRLDWSVERLQLLERCYPRTWSNEHHFETLSIK